MMCTDPGRTLESEVPAEFVEWAAYCPRIGPRVASTLEEAICTLRFGNLDFLTDVVTAWRRHADPGCDQSESVGETRARIQTRFIRALTMEPLQPASPETCKRIVAIAINYARGGMDLKSTKDTLLYRYIERTLTPAALAAIPFTEAPYEANSPNPSAERIIKEITTDREPADIIASFEPSTTYGEAFALLLYTVFVELWNGQAPECHINTNLASASRISLCLFTETFGGSDFPMGIFQPGTNTLYVPDGPFPVPSLIYHLIRMAEENQLMSVVEAHPGSAQFAASRYAVAS